MHAQKYVHGYDGKENRRLQDQASTLVELLHATYLIWKNEKLIGI